MTQPDTARVTLLSDGNCMSDGGGQYGLVPRVRWTQLQTPDAQNRIIQVLRCVLIRVGGKTILVDCGCGDKALVGDYYPIERPAGTLLDDLARQGVAPEQIDIVILTHLHGDHCGWATRAVGGRYAGINTPYDPDNFAPTFPRARYFVQRAEYEAASRPNERTRNTYFPENYQPLLAQGVLTLLEGDGDFRSAECIRLLQEADIVATNPPFSLFREYVAQLVEYKKKFLILGSQNAITYKEVFRLIKDNVLWLGVDNGGTKWFRVPDHYEIQTESRKKVENGIKYFSMGSVYWFTNLDHSKRHESITLYQQYTPEAYPRYDNYDAIEVAKTADIPYDYEGAMGVPITFLDRYNPEQFEILGITKTWFGGASKIYPNQIQVNADGSQSVVSKLNDGATIRVDTPPQGKTYYIVGDDYYIQLYARILIKRKGAAQ